MNDGGPYFQLPVQVNTSSDSMPTSPTAVTSVDTALYQATFEINSGNAITVTLVAGGDASFIPLVFSVQPLTPYCLVWPRGLLFSGGLTWSSASGTVVATLRGTRKAAFTISNGVATGSV